MDVCPYPRCRKPLANGPDTANGHDVSGEVHSAARCPVHGWLADDVDCPVALTPIHKGPPFGGLNAPSLGGGPTGSDDPA